jgi:hypothetical protein
MPHLEKRKKTTVEIPESILKDALRVSGKSINETVSLGLRLVAAQDTFDELLKLRGSYKSGLKLKTLRADR